MTMYIHRFSYYHNTVEDELPALKEAVKVACGKHFRRVDRFIQLALIGSHQCVDKLPPANCGLYIGSYESCKTGSASALKQIYANNEMLKPLHFINMVSNAAIFYIAQSLNMNAGGMFLSCSHAALEKSLQLAQADLDDGSYQHALVGIVDECADPIRLQKILLGYQADEAIALGESSFWLQTSAISEGAIAQVIDNCRYSNWPALLEKLQQLSPASINISYQHLSEQEEEQLKALPYNCENSLVHPVKQKSKVSGVLNDFLASAKASQEIICISSNATGVYSMLHIRRC